MSVNLEEENDSRMCCEAHSAICQLYPEDQIESVIWKRRGRGD